MAIRFGKDLDAQTSFVYSHILSGLETIAEFAPKGVTEAEICAAFVNYAATTLINPDKRDDNRATLVAQFCQSGRGTLGQMLVTQLDQLLDFTISLYVPEMKLTEMLPGFSHYRH